MPYSLSSSNLPSYIKTKPDSIKAKWIAIFNAVYEKDGEEAAFIAANSWLKKNIKEKVATGKTEIIRERIQFVIDTKEFIKKTDDDEEYISAVLADNLPDSQGDAIPENILLKWAKEINDNMPVGDIDHELYKNLLRSDVSDSMIEKSLSEKKGIAKAVRAVVDNGKLWIRAIIDKRYKNLVEKAKGLSIEAILERDSDKNIVDGKFLGFTFGVNTEPVNQRAIIV
jgi:hypothetical protein